MFKKFSFFLFFFGLFFMFNPFKNAYAFSTPSHTTPTWYSQKKSDLISYFEYIIQGNVGKSDEFYQFILIDASNQATPPANDRLYILTDEDGRLFVSVDKLTSVNYKGVYYQVQKDGKITSGSTSPAGMGNITGTKVQLHGSTTDGFYYQVIGYKGINFANTESKNLLDTTIPPPPSINDEGNFGYEFIYPKNNDVINLLNNNNSSYLKVPFKVKVKNLYALGYKKVEERIRNDFKINNYKTEITNFIWEKKTDILALSDYGLFYIEGYYYIPIGIVEDNLSVTIYDITDPWLDGSIKVTYTYDGSKPNYNPIDNGGSDSGGSIDDNGNVNIGGKDYGEIPSAPVEGDIGDWIQYLGELLLWLVTYPFKLLGQMVSTLTGYITSMFGILTPVTAQLNSVLSFVPSDILNVCWGFLSFTILYSVLKSVFKMIRG